MNYRPDIDGLRAVAIVPVVLFHAGVSGFRGGFVGVDVFFVISGYLITSFIAEEIRAGRFSIVAFYERRIRRIFPALFAVLLCVSIAASLILLPADLKAFARSVAAVGLFGSNILFWGESGYFDADATTKPLLHTWSLAVEEQFYVFFPLVLIAARQLLKDRWALALVPLAAASFGWNLWQAPLHPASAFYLAQSRVWELFLGSFAALGALPVLRARAVREAACAAGLGLIAISVLGFSRHTVFPGMAALLPCLGALALLHAASDTTVGRLLSTRAFVFVGLISYPLYLWHWPLLVFARHLALHELSAAEALPWVALSFVLAALTWKLVEQPVRRRGIGQIGRQRLFALATAGFVACMAFGVLTAQSPDSVALHGDYVAQHIRGREDYRAGNCFLDPDQAYRDWSRRGPCLIDHKAERTVLIWGDSFAAQYVPGLAANPQAMRLNFVEYSAASCPPVLGARIPWAPNCPDFNDHLGDVLRRFKPASVVLAARWERYWGKYVTEQALQETVAYLRAQGLPVVLIGQSPSFPFEDPAEYRYRTGRDHARAKPSDLINGDIRRISGYSAFFDPAALLCPGGDCSLTSKGQFLYYDSGHFSTYGSQLISASLVKAISASVP